MGVNQTLSSFLSFPNPISSFQFFSYSFILCIVPIISYQCEILSPVHRDHQNRPPLHISARHARFQHYRKVRLRETESPFCIRSQNYTFSADTVHRIILKVERRSNRHSPPTHRFKSNLSRSLVRSRSGQASQEMGDMCRALY